MIESMEKIKRIYSVSEWEIVEENFVMDNNYRNETIFSLANGYIGMRGTFEEGYKFEQGQGLEGTFINGFYDSEEIKYGELAHAYAKKSQTMLNVTNSKIIRLKIEDEEFSMLEGEIESYKRTLSFKTGCVERSLIWTSPKGKKIEIKTSRVISFKDKHLAAIRYEIQPVNFEGVIAISSKLDGDVFNSTAECNTRIDYGPYGRSLITEKSIAEDNLMVLLQKTSHTELKLVCGAQNFIFTNCEYNKKTHSDAFSATTEYIVNAKKQEKIRLEKYIIYMTPEELIEEEILRTLRAKLSEAGSAGFKKLLQEQTEYLSEFWSGADIEIKGDDALQQGIRYNMFQLLQSAGRDGKISLGAKGLSGEGYEGHYFWDTEMYALPFFIYTNPDIAKSLLKYRYNTLDKARKRAKEMSIERGALFPWRTINGEEASAYYPAGTAQVHINADIAFAVQKYIDSTNDTEFIKEAGAEILIETARFWMSYGAFIDSKAGQFCINGVTGPDEFAVLVNNNAYTNMMARENLNNAYHAVQWMKKNCIKSYELLCKKISLGDEEYQLWKHAADNMYIPYCEEKGIYPQDDSFLYKKPWDIKNTPVDMFPLLNNHHPLVVYRHQVSKQADLILALCLLNNKFQKEDVQRNFDFYETVTVHESSLSACIFSIVANNIGYKEKAYNYFMRTSRLDLDDYHRDTKAGIHCANMAGTWMSIVYGFAGMEVYEDMLSFRPKLPEQWQEFRFKVNYRNRLLQVIVDKKQTQYQLIHGEDIIILHNGEKKLIKNNR